MDFKQLAILSMRSKAEADKVEALTSLDILLSHPAGIGDHSTSDLHKNLNESLSQLADAEDRISTLNSYFPQN